MGLEFHRGNTERQIIKAQKNAMTLHEIAKGYEHEAAVILHSKVGEAIRRELKKHMAKVLGGDPRDQEIHLNALARDLKPFEAFLGDTWKDEEERAPLCLALARLEKSKQ